MKTSARLIVSTVLLSAAGVAGCSSDNVSYHAVTSNLTPELHGLAQRPSDSYNAFAIASNADLRMFWDDLGRTFYYDQPTKLSPFPITNVSGQPR